MPAREPAQWPQLTLGTGVRLMLGWRGAQRTLEARPVRVRDDIAEVLRQACADSLNSMTGMERRIYSGVPAIDPGQYLALVIEPGEAQAGDVAEAEPDWRLPEERAATAQLLRIIDGALEAEDWLTRNELREGKWLFYAVVVELSAGNGEVLTFVRRSTLQRGLGAGHLQLAARGATLTRFDDPLFNFDFAFDLIVAPDEIAIFKVSAFNTVFSDIEVAKLHVPDHVRGMVDGLQARFAQGSDETLLELCQQSSSFATRLRRLAHARFLGSVDLPAIRTALERHDIARDRLGANRLRIVDRDDVEVLFDLLEGLYYEADFTGEARRALRYSVRS